MTTLEDGMRKKIQAELTGVLRWIASLRGEPRPEELESGGDNTPISEEMDAAQVVEEVELRTQLVDWLVQRAGLLEDALRHLREGTYGLCAGCGAPIHRARLEALPEAALCLRCQEMNELCRPTGPPTGYGWSETAQALDESADKE